MIDTIVYQDNTMKEGCDLALSHRLFVAGWSLSGELLHMRTWHGSGEKLALAFKDQVPVAVVIWSGRMFQAFCRASERRQGYASAALKALNIPQGVGYADTGIDGSQSFWFTNNVRLSYDRF